MGRRLGVAVASMLAAGPLAAQPRPAQEAIGSWELTCPAGRGACLLRHQNWVLPPGDGRPSAALEVQRRGDALVPVVALRGLPMQAAVAGALVMQASAGLRFDGGAPIALACGLDGIALACAPQGAEVAQSAAALPTAHTLVVQIALTVPGLAALPEQDRTLALAQTEQALARYRAAGATGEALPAEAGLDWQGFLDRVLHAAGFRNGAADLLPRG